MFAHKAEDAGGLTQAKDDNAVSGHFYQRTFLFISCCCYKAKIKLVLVKGGLNYE